MIDTNVLISAIYNPNSLPAQVVQFVEDAHIPVLSEYIVDECRAVINRKFPHHLSALEVLLVGLNPEIVPSTLRQLNNGVQAMKTCPRILCGELPLDGAASVVPAALPCKQLAVQGVDVVYPPVEALPA